MLTELMPWAYGVVVTVFAVWIGRRYLLLTEIVQHDTAEREKQFLLDYMIESSNVRADYDRLYERQFDRMMSLIDPDAVKTTVNARTAETRINQKHQRLLARAQAEAEPKDELYVPPSEREEATMQVGVAAIPDKF